MGRADGGEQHRIGGLAGLEGAVGQGFAGGVNGNAAHGLHVVDEAEAMAAADRIEQLAGYRHDFRADAVAGKQGDPVARRHGP